MTSSIEYIPKVCVQNDWNNPSGGHDTAWFSYAQDGQKPKYEQLEINKSTFNQDLPYKISGSDNVSATLIRKAISSIDISCGGELGVSADGAGKLSIWNAKTGVIMRQLVGHLNTVSQCRFFPSGVVVLSGGDDMLLKVWSAEDASCPVTFMGHTGGIVDTAFVDRGKNVISCSRDGSTRLWDCSTSKCVSVLCKESTIPTFCSLASSPDSNGNDESKPDKLLMVGYENGNVRFITLKDQREVFELSFPSSIVDCCFIDDNTFVLAYDNGMIKSYDIRSTSQPLKSLSFYKTKPVSMTTDNNKRVIFSTADGCCLCFNILDLKLESITSLTGPDCDTINDVSSHNNNIYTACRDGIIRSYYL